MSKKWYPVILGLLTLLMLSCVRAGGYKAAGMPDPAKIPGELHYVETMLHEEGQPDVNVGIVFRDGTVEKHPVIMVLGIPGRVLGEATAARPSVDPAKLPEWSVDLIREGYMLATWCIPPAADQTKAVQSGPAAFTRAVSRVIDCLVMRDDVNPTKIGWFGASASGIPALSVAAVEKRIAAVMVFVSSNKPEFAEKIYPTAVLIVNGGADTVVKPEGARNYYNAAKPFYRNDPWRLRLVIYEGETHNLPLDVVKLYAEHWFHLYLHPTKEPPTPPDWLLAERKPAE